MTNVNAVVKFVIVYHKNDYHAMTSECDKIEREIEETVEVQVPQSIIGLLQNLSWTEKLDLVISVSGCSTIDLRDKDVKTNIVSNRSSQDKGEGIVRKIGGWFLRL
jgi:hypothetical protein